MRAARITYESESVSTFGAGNLGEWQGVELKEGIRITKVRVKSSPENLRIVEFYSEGELV